MNNPQIPDRKFGWSILVPETVKLSTEMKLAALRDPLRSAPTRHCSTAPAQHRAQR